MLQKCMEHLHIIGISGIWQLVKDHKLHHSAQIISVSIQKLPAKHEKHEKNTFKKGFRLYSTDLQLCRV